MIQFHQFQTNRIKREQKPQAILCRRNAVLSQASPEDRAFYINQCAKSRFEIASPAMTQSDSAHPSRITETKPIKGLSDSLGRD
jgi:hypothetical protein